MKTLTSELLVDLGRALACELLLQAEKAADAVYEYLTGEDPDEDEELLRQAALR